MVNIKNINIIKIVDTDPIMLLDIAYYVAPSIY